MNKPDNLSALPRCKGARVDGEPCRAPAVTPAGYCYFHDPSLAGQRRASRQKGGETAGRVTRLRCSRLNYVYEKLLAVLDESSPEKFDHSRAVAMASLARAMVSFLEAGELEERVRILEDHAKTNPYHVIRKLSDGP
jgi:hypothetical protein